MKYRLSHIQVIALGYIIMILIGTGILMLPLASVDGQSAPFREAFFTATSASCVTGLILRDTATCWSLFGQIVIIVLIQIGGLGFMTIATMFFMLLGKKMGLRQRQIMVESINTSQIGGILRLTRQIITRTAVFELTGAILLSVRFIPKFGLLQGIWYSIFHSISAFCNAGFDLMGVVAPFDSLVSMADDWYFNIVIMLLITIGGLGFLVWEDIRQNGFRWKRYKLHTKLVLTVSGILTFGGAVLFFLMEKNTTGANLSVSSRILTALFNSVTARTAGFNTIDLAAMSDSSKLFMILLMVVGGSPGSTAGGVKTVTVAVLFIYGIENMRGNTKPSIFGRTLPGEALNKSVNILLFNVSIALAASIVICSAQSIDLVDVLFETFSAIGTVGVTTGITRELTVFSSYIIILLMYLGRVGSVSFAVALLEKKARAPITFPVEDITVG